MAFLERRSSEDSDMEPTEAQMLDEFNFKLLDLQKLSSAIRKRNSKLLDRS